MLPCDLDLTYDAIEWDLRLHGVGVRLPLIPIVTTCYAMPAKDRKRPLTRPRRAFRRESSPPRRLPR